MSKKQHGREPRPEPRRYEIQFTRAAERGLALIPKVDLRRVDAVVLGLAGDQHPSGSKKLRGAGDLYRIRVGDYRVVYTIEVERLVVLVVNVGNRRDIYRSL
ncbi:MAG: type II toxin-antitoxin system RelE/ParE family toxin [Isosphaerales bacterium]